MSETPKRKILIIDDSEYHVEVISSQLLAEGYEVETASDGQEGLEKAQHNPPNLIMLDIVMPGLSGYDVCRLLKDDERTRFIPVILITALGDAYDKVKGLEAGADDFLVKPLNTVEMLARIRALLKQRELIEKQRKRDLYIAEISKLLDIEQLRREEETKRKQLYNEVVSAVTNGKLHLIERDNIEALRREEKEFETIAVESAEDVAAARRHIERLGAQLGLSEKRVYDLALCVSEATTNIIKHAEDGLIRLAQSGQSLRIWVEDNGPGIEYTNLSKATLMRGYSSKSSLGYGFTIMLEYLDAVYLCTDRLGTTLLLEMNLVQKEPEMDVDRFLSQWQDSP